MLIADLHKHVNSLVCVFAGTSDYNSPYEAKLTKTLKKFTAKPVTQVCYSNNFIYVQYLCSVGFKKGGGEIELSAFRGFCLGKILLILSEHSKKGVLGKLLVVVGRIKIFSV